ncbi:MAG TPA: sigma-70 family RNA polymerase sigma factor [Steroidobacteraceae bacterium]|nr:sigma-70 family RNA polymerase sigma factor [Steroidobacteraceae bacterium]
MVAYASGNARAFDELYARHKGGTYRYFLRHVGGQRATAEELHQDLWLKVIGARNRYAATARFATWLYTLARHRLVDHWRSRQDARWVSLAEDIEPEAAPGAAEALMQAEGCDPLRAAMDAQSSRQLLSALEAVSTLQRDAFLLHIEGGLPLEEIARLTGASMETVKSRLRYAYRKLRSALGEMQ